MPDRRRVLICALLACALAGCKPSAPAGGGAAQGLARTLATRTLRAAFINYPPSMIVDPNTKAKSGIMVDALGDAAAAMGLKVEYVEETSFGTMIDTVESGRADIVVSGIWPSSARALRADFSRVVYYSPVYAYVRRDDARFDGNLDAANAGGVRIATIDGELSSIVAHSDYPSAAIVSLPQQTDVSQLLLQLAARKADITFVEPAIAEQFIAKNGGSLRRVGNAKPVRVFPNTFLFRKGDTGLRDAVNIAILELTNAGRIGGIVKPYDPQGTLFTLPVPPASP